MKRTGAFAVAPVAALLAALLSGCAGYVHLGNTRDDLAAFRAASMACDVETWRAPDTASPCFITKRGAD